MGASADVLPCVNSENLAAWLVQGLRRRELAVQDGHRRADQILAVLGELVAEGDVRPRAALDMAVHLGRVLMAHEVSMSCVTPAVAALYDRSVALLADGEFEHDSVSKLTDGLRKALTQIAEGP